MKFNPNQNFGAMISTQVNSAFDGAVRPLLLRVKPNLVHSQTLVILREEGVQNFV